MARLLAVEADATIDMDDEYNVTHQVVYIRIGGTTIFTYRTEASRWNMQNEDWLIDDALKAFGEYLGGKETKEEEVNADS